jgi:hypothetical protein
MPLTMPEPTRKGLLTKAHSLLVCTYYRDYSPPDLCILCPMQCAHTARKALEGMCRAGGDVRHGEGHPRRAHSLQGVWCATQSERMAPAHVSWQLQVP